MEDKEKTQISLNILLNKKRKLLELREVIKAKSPCNRLNDLEQDDIRYSETLFSADIPSITPPPFSPLTPLVVKAKQTNEYGELNSDSENDISFLTRTSPLIMNLDNDDPLSSPLRPMTPKTQELFNVLVESEGLRCYSDATDDLIYSPNLVIQNSKQAANCDSETDCETDEEIPKLTQRSYTNDTEIQRKTVNINNTGKKDDTPKNILTEKEEVDKQKKICDIPTENNSLHEIRPFISGDVAETTISPTLTANIEETGTVSTEKNKKGRSRKERQNCKMLRNTGKSYVTEKGKVVPEREIKDLGSCRLKCAERISVTEREQCFEQYWKFGGRDRRASFISKSVTILPKKTQRTDSIYIKRDCYCIYKLYISNEDKLVCKECFCRILGETKGFINVIIEKKKESSTGIVDTDQRGLKPPKNKKTIEELSVVRNHINSFPSYESHYCRKSTGKKFLPSDLSISKMYRDYKNSVPKPVSLKLYAKCFHDLNLSFKQPSKDTCNTCDVLNTKIKVADGDNKAKLITELTEHQTLAEKAYEEQRIDKEIVKGNTSIKALTFDLQQCLPTPYLKTSVSFYKRQLWSFNLTIHDLSNNEATCYLWDETIGARGANQIASCLWHFCNGLAPEVKEVIFYSDTCGGQNKNNIVTMMFLYLVKHHPTLEKISHKFLISGHTHMECDSDHAIIEKTKKKTQMKIYHLYDWVQLIRTCKVQKPFHVVVMTLENFFDFSSLKTKKGPYSIKKQDECGKKFLWQPVKWLQYNKTVLGKFLFKHNLDRNSSFESINFNKRGKLSNDSFRLKQISKESLPISVEKKKDLMDLLDLIDVSFREFYINLKTTDCKSIDPDIDEVNPDLEEDT